MRNKLNSKAFFFAVILLITLFFSCRKKESDTMYADDTSLVEVLVNSKIIVGVDSQNPPMCSYNSENEIEGFDVDVFKEIADILNIDVEFKTIVPSEAENLINSRAIDCIASGFSYTDQRNEIYELTRPYLRNAVVLLTLKSNNIKNIKDLKGKKIAGQMGGLGLTLIKNNPELMNQIYLVEYLYNNIPQILNSLKNHEVDACVGDISIMATYLTKEPDTYSLIEEAIALDSFVYAFKKGSTALKEEVENALFEMEEAGRLEKISRKWFGTNMVIFGK
ncbi:substrate-binding periplasmic protein [Treponema putidum]|uniref:Amino acid ABC transporter substrate-binding protein n=1 Tax=Treponema putidum TaxID=221027 RepID=A0AAE9MU52_9SPIR|nr:transporter substrate-binding domain-containing protein [Treponema putidum]AIN93997.1 ABC transporter substrate-binding protein [Treponema putidum]TWI76953.1 polar amino acid transport system substrate-binding protein [Treponema putidum]UTY27932.1 amino acid ABC transporter substrate-binding protein [Treponema putidum]UTY30377.1 amino acid ABC transporter substrate-binding protein [Treponema putidum]UTY32846.1 amino acid ABC transporter substrate-binding protein [Treponema putidum]